MNRKQQFHDLSKAWDLEEICKSIIMEAHSNYFYKRYYENMIINLGEKFTSKEWYPYAYFYLSLIELFGRSYDKNHDKEYYRKQAVRPLKDLL